MSIIFLFFLDFWHGFCNYIYMLEISIYSLGTLPTFDRTTSDSNYWQERYAYERSMMLYLMAAQGFVSQQVESDDIDDAWADFDTYVGNDSSGLTKWISDSITTRESGGTPTAPPALPKTLDLTGQLGLANILAQIKVHTDLSLFRFGGSTNGGAGGDTDVSDAIDAINTTLEDGLLKTVGAETYPVIELLAAVPIRIFVNRDMDIQDVSIGEVV